MFCPQCGKELIEIEGKHICTNCQEIVVHAEGAAVAQPTATEPIVNVEALKHATGTATDVVKKAKKKTWLRVALVLALVCFFFPFCTVSCGSESIQASGFEAMIGSREDDLAANAFLIIALITTLGTLALSFAENASIPTATAVFSGVSAFMVFLFRVTIFAYYDLMEDRDYIHIETEWGWWACLLLLITAVVLAVMWQNESQSTMTPPSGSNPPPPQNNPYGYGAAL